MESAAWGLIGTLIGASSSIATTFLVNRNAARLQRDAALIERIEKQKAFQRETLLELQDAFHDAIRLIAQIHLEDERILRETGVWGRGQLPDDLSDGLRTINRKVVLLVERVANDSVRDAVKRVMSNANAVTAANSRDESSARLESVMGESTRAIEQIGKILRGLY